VRTVVEKREAKRYLVTGIVQGVGFRFFTERVAEQLGIAGFVRNRHDSRVEVYAIGTPEQHRALRRELERGPRGASVERVEEEAAQLDPRYADDFSIEYNA
jgi:acylphosphatase